MQATKKPHNYHKTVVWQIDDRIRKSPLKFYVYYYNELSGDCQVSIFTELWRLSVAFCVTLWHMSIYFAHPMSPWERGSNEQINGLLRQYIPKNTYQVPFSAERLAEFTEKLNHRPRKCLNWNSPSEIFSNLLLHLT